MTRRVQDGDPLIIQPKDWNRMLDGLDHSNGAGPGRAGAFRQTVTVNIRNDVGADLPRFGVVGLGSPLITPDVNEDEFLRSICLSGVAASPESDYDLKWGITLRPIRKDEFGPVVIQGLCYCMLDDATATTAQPKDGSFLTLTGADCGLARVIWRAAGTGPQWAIVCLG